MPIRDLLLPEFDHEVANTRRLLERVPEDRPDFRPHEKSMTLAQLAGHLAALPHWAIFALTRTELDLAPRDGSGKPPELDPPPMTSRATLLEAFDSVTRDVRSRLTEILDDELMQKWTLRKGGHVVFTLPRISVIRLLCFNHAIHHRAQLGVYLRLNDVPLPPVYGPTADADL